MNFGALKRMAQFVPRWGRSYSTHTHYDWSLNPISRRVDEWKNRFNLKKDDVENASEEQLKDMFDALRKFNDTGMMHFFTSFNQKGRMSISVLSESTRCLASMKHPETAISLLGTALKKGWNLNNPVYRSLIEAFLRKNDESGALFVFSMIPEVRAPDLYGLVLPSLCNRDRYEEAVGILRVLGPDYMIEHSMVFNSMFMKNHMDSYTIFAYMIKTGVRPNFLCFADFRNGNSFSTLNPEVQVMIRYLMGISAPRLEETFARLRSIPLPAYSRNSKNQSSVRTYYFVVGNAKVMLDKEVNYQNHLAERICLLEESDMERDFWIVIEPMFLGKFPMLTSILERPAVAIVSTSSSWIRFMKSKLNCVLFDSYTAVSQEEALACTPGKWVAPYPKTEPGWWEPFLPAKSENQKDVYFDDGCAEEQGDFDVSSPVCHPYEGICTPCSTYNVDKPADTEGGSTGAA